MISLILKCICIATLSAHCRFLFTVNMTAVAGCAFVTNSSSISRTLDTFENISEVYINRAPINAKEL